MFGPLHQTPSDPYSLRGNGAATALPVKSDGLVTRAIALHSLSARLTPVGRLWATDPNEKAGPFDLSGSEVRC